MPATTEPPRPCCELRLICRSDWQSGRTDLPDIRVPTTGSARIRCSEKIERGWRCIRTDCRPSGMACRYFHAGRSLECGPCGDRCLPLRIQSLERQDMD